jgi:predicted transcriptional regulator
MKRQDEPVVSAGNGTTRQSAAGQTRIAKVSHTLSAALADRLEEFAFRQRVSESAVIEYALAQFFDGRDDAELGELLRASGAGRRRKNS